MKRIKQLGFLIVLAGAVSSCSTEPEPIKYGEDACHFCEMTIVSQAHSARAVSTKGKQFKYDAIECMVHDIIRNETEMAVKQVADFSHPGNMIAVEKARFVINDSINSPMGANLAAVKEEAAKKTGEVYTWNELKHRFLSEESITLNH